MSDFMCWEDDYLNMDYVHVMFVKQFAEDCFAIVYLDHQDVERFVTKGKFKSLKEAQDYLSHRMLTRIINNMNI